MSTGFGYTFRDGDWTRLRQIIQQLSERVGPGSEPTHSDITLTSLSASKLIATDGDKKLVSSDLYGWIAGTANRVTVADDGDGTVTLSGPQDIHTGASPSFASLTLAGALTNTIPAATQIPFSFDGDTNPYNWAASANFTIFPMTRTINGSGEIALPVPLRGRYNIITWDYDYTGTTGGWTGKQIFAGGDVLSVTCDTVINAGLTASGTYLVGNVSGVNWSGAITTSKTFGSTTGNPMRLWGGWFTSRLTSTITSTGGTTNINIEGGHFSTSGSNPTVASGTVNLNYFGGYFEGIGTTAGNSTVYGGYFTGTGGDTNYGVYSAAGLNYFAEGTTLASTLDVTGLSTLTGKAVLGAGSTTVAPLKFTTGTALTTPEAGAMEYHDKTFWATENNVRRAVALCDEVLVAPVSVTNTTDETTVFTAPIAANALRISKVILITLCGKYSTHDAADVLTVNVYLGSTLVGTFSSTGNATNAPFRLQSINTVRTINIPSPPTNGTLSSYSNAVINDVSKDSYTSETSIDTTTTNNFYIKMQWNNDQSSITIDQGFVQVM